MENLARHTRAKAIGTLPMDWTGKWLTGSSRAAASLRDRIARKEVVKPGTGKYDENPAIANMSAVSWGPTPSFSGYPVSRASPIKTASLIEEKQQTSQQEHLAESKGVRWSPSAADLDRSEYSDMVEGVEKEQMAKQDCSVELANDAHRYGA